MDKRIHVRESFEIPPEAQRAIQEWQATLPPHDGRVDRPSRYSYTFTDNGMVDEIRVRDQISGKVLDWAPPDDDW